MYKCNCLNAQIICEKRPLPHLLLISIWTLHQIIIPINTNFPRYFTNQFELQSNSINTDNLHNQSLIIMRHFQMNLIINITINSRLSFHIFLWIAPNIKLIIRNMLRIKAYLLFRFVLTTPFVYSHALSVSRHTRDLHNVVNVLFQLGVPSMLD